MTKDTGAKYVGDELLLTAWLLAPNGRVVKVPMGNDGILVGSANDGWYAARGNLREAADLARMPDAKGTWTIYAMGQTVNAARPGMTPMEAAQFIGAEPVVTPLSLSYGAGQCKTGRSITVEVLA